ncbi:MAG: hypothetical protein K2W95_31275 [Candidatus Obscuribacterales bacterium]|nr:hypothetical protein [Candidatus Obscuribacterales bacterium]
MNKLVMAGLAAAFLGALFAPVSNACDDLHTSSFTVSSPVTIDACDPCATAAPLVLERQIVAPVLVEHEMTSPVIIDRSCSSPGVLERNVSMPVLLERDNNLIDFDSPILRFGLF